MTLRLLITLGMLVSPLGAQACADCPGMMKCETSPRGCLCCKPAARSPRQAVKLQSSCCAKKTTVPVARAMPVVCSVMVKAEEGRRLLKTCVCCIRSSPAEPIPAVPSSPTSTELVKAKFAAVPAILAGLSLSGAETQLADFDPGTLPLKYRSACDRQASLCVWLN